MEWREAGSMAVRSVRAHPLRSALTVVGVVIGIAAVVAFATFGASVEADVVGQFEGTGANNVYVFAAPGDDDGFGQSIQPVFTQADVDALRELNGVRAVIPQGVVRVSSISRGDDSVAIREVTATVPETFANDSIVAGRAFESGAAEVVVDERAARSFEGNLSVGDELVLSASDGTTSEVTVVGVVNGTRGSLPGSQFEDRPRVYVPVDPFYETVVESPTVGVRQQAYPQVTVVTDPTRTTEVQEAVQTYLDERSDARRLASDGVELEAQTGGDFVDQVASVIEQITRFVTGIAVIALVVGAIGIANVMLVSVTERTREIGIMKAVGARNRDVMQLFVLEAGLLGAAGAVVGVPVGVAAGWLATRYADVGFSLAPGWMAIGVAVGVLVGVVSGVYPAWRAARVDPIDALRRE